MAESENTEWVRARLERWSKQRDGEALGELLKWQRDRAFASAFRILGQASDADDAVQQAFLKMLTRTHGFASTDEFKIAVYRAVTQCALDLIRANRVRVRLEKAMVGIESATSSQALPDPEQAEKLNLVWREMEALSEEQRAIVVLCCQEGLSASDAAEILSVPRETLRDRLKSALEALRARLAKRGLTATAVMLAALIQQGAAQAASPVLCEALDATLPGKPCAEITAQQPTPSHPQTSAPLNVQSGGNAFGWGKAVAGLAALLLIGVGVAWKAGEASRETVVRTPTSAAASTNTATDTGSAALASRPAAKAPETLEAPAETKAAKAAPVRVRAVNPDAIPLDKVPQVVLAACSRSVPGIQIIEAEIETEAGKRFYEVKGRAAAGVMELKVTPEGQVFEVGLDDDDDDGDAVVPKAKPEKPVLPTADF